MSGLVCAVIALSGWSVASHLLGGLLMGRLGLS